VASILVKNLGTRHLETQRPRPGVGRQALCRPGALAARLDAGMNACTPPQRGLPPALSRWLGGSPGGPALPCVTNCPPRPSLRRSKLLPPLTAHWCAAAFPSCVRSILTEIYLKSSLFLSEMLSGNAAAGGDPVRPIDRRHASMPAPCQLALAGRPRILCCCAAVLTRWDTILCVVWHGRAGHVHSAQAHRLGAGKAVGVAGGGTTPPHQDHTYHLWTYIIIIIC
jgi:hypothetical protein